MDELYVEEFSYSVGKRKHFPLEQENQELKTEAVLEEHTPFGYFKLLEQVIKTESQNPNFFIPFLNEIQAKLEKGDSSGILHLTDEIEEFLDLELLRRS